MEQMLQSICEKDKHAELSANRPLVSAIITTHNRRGLLERALCSAVMQTYQPMEIVVVDDNSTDDTKAFIEKKQEQCPIIRYVHIPEEQSCGGNHARNIGIEAAQGEWIAFLDDDDVWVKEKTEKQMDYLLRHPDTKVISCDIIRTFITKKRTYQEQGNYHFNYNTPMDFFAQSWVNVTSTIIASKEALVSVGKFDEQLPAQQELELSYRLCLKYKAAYLHPLVQYNTYFNSVKQLTTDNGVEKYDRAIQIIEQKFAEELAMLSTEQKKRRVDSTCRERAIRYYIAKNNRMYRKMMKPIVKGKWHYILEYMASYVLSYRQWIILRCILCKWLHQFKAK